MKKTENSHDSSPQISVSICGSYNKHLKQIGDCIEESKRLGIRVLIPKHAVKVRSTKGFCILRGEKGQPRDLQDHNFGAIAMSDFILVVNPEGYIGPSTSLEVGYAIAKHIPVYCTERPTQYIFHLYTKWGMSLAEIKDELSPPSLIPQIEIRKITTRTV
jgi:nucleoside 2-deoxyribosyltransferase